MAEAISLIRDFVFASCLAAIFIYDLRYMLIPDRITLPAMVVAIVLNLWLGVVPAWSLIAGGLVLATFFWVQLYISRGTWVGGGDIRMGALMGLMLGLWQGLEALFIAYVLGAIVSVVLMLAKKANCKTQIPFGTFLCIGTLIALLAGQHILDWYFGFFV